MDRKIINVGIYGVGLIGGSLGLALKRFNRKSRIRRYRIFGIGRNPSKLKKAGKLGALDQFTTEPGEVLGKMDVLVLAMRVDLISGFAKKVIGELKDGAILTDVGSVKGKLDKNINGIINAAGKNVIYIPGHPIAGSEKTGAENAKSDMFDGTYCVLTRRKNSSFSGYSKLSRMWKDAGAKIIVIDPGAHDAILAATSHMPHILSMLLMLQAESTFKKYHEMLKLYAGSFRDMTRISDSDPDSWDKICSENRDEIISAVDDYIAGFKKIKAKLKKGDSIRKYFESARLLRNKCFHSTK